VKSFICSCLSVALVSLVAGSTVAQIERIDPDRGTGSAQAVIVDDLPLIHTRQIFPFENDRPLVRDDARKQTEALLRQLQETLLRSKSDLTNAVKLNWYLKEDGLRPAVEQVIAERFRDAGPAVTYTASESSESGVVVSLDAIAVSTAVGTKEVAFGSFGKQGVAEYAVLPPGPRIYISGMADTNELVTATRKTLEKLMAAAAHLGVGTQDVVQLKAFVQPMSRAADVQAEIIRFFGRKTPPLVFVEWISPAPNPPIEIELIAAGELGLSTSQESVSFLTPPGTTSTKVFSRVARVNHGKVIYYSGSYGSADRSGADQTKALFESLKPILAKTGTDLEHLVKATYYVSDDDAGNALNDVRLQFFNPQRPPAASKAKVKSVGSPGRTICVDLMAAMK